MVIVQQYGAGCRLGNFPGNFPVLARFVTEAAALAHGHH